MPVQSVINSYLQPGSAPVMLEHVALSVSLRLPLSAAYSAPIIQILYDRDKILERRKLESSEKHLKGQQNFNLSGLHEVFLKGPHADEVKVDENDQFQSKLSSSEI